MIRQAISPIENLSPRSTDYLVAIYALEADGTGVTTGALARRLNLKPASVTGTLRRLDRVRPRLVDYVRYRGVTLTPVGRASAQRVIRRQRLLELYLVKTLGYGWKAVRPQARQLAHAISSDFEARIASLLGDPALDSHGNPLISPVRPRPSLAGRLPDVALRRQVNSL